MDMYVHTQVHAHVYVCMRVCVCVYACTYVCMQVPLAGHARPNLAAECQGTQIRYVTLRLIVEVLTLHAVGKVELWLASGDRAR